MGGSSTFAAGCCVWGVGKACCGSGSGKGITGRTGKVITGGITGIGFGDAGAVGVGHCCGADLHAAIIWAGACRLGCSLSCDGMGIALGG